MSTTTKEAQNKLEKITSIMKLDLQHLNTSEQAIVKNEYIVKILLGVEIDDQEKKELNRNGKKNERKISTPIQELIRQYEMVPCTTENNDLLRTFLALMLNGRQIDITDAFRRTFPEYH